jgi:hypothetical protein
MYTQQTEDLTSDVIKSSEKRAGSIIFSNTLEEGLQTKNSNYFQSAQYILETAEND